MSEKINYEQTPTGHYKELFPSKNELLGSHNLNQGEEIVAQIKSITKGTIKDHAGKDKEINVLHFESKVTQMGLNITNADVVAAMYGEVHAHWVGKWVQIYVGKVKNPKGGGMIDGLKIRPTIPTNDIDLSDFEDKLRNCADLKELASAFTSFKPHIQKALIPLKDELKGKLS